MINEADRFNIDHPELCPHLRWKMQFVQVDHDPTVPPSNDGSFWCVNTQTCVGPDGRLAEPGECVSPERGCYGAGQVA